MTMTINIDSDNTIVAIFILMIWNTMMIIIFNLEMIRSIQEQREDVEEEVKRLEYQVKLKSFFVCFIYPNEYWRST